jgi:hypothetical protein
MQSSNGVKLGAPLQRLPRATNLCVSGKLSNSDLRKQIADEV